MRMVISRRRGSPPPNSGTAATTGISRSRRPPSYRTIAMLVVAITLEIDARSNMVSGVTIGESGSYVKRPNAFRATSLPLYVSATDAPGNARTAMASLTMPNARWKRASCCSKAGAAKCANVFGILVRTRKTSDKEYKQP